MLERRAGPGSEQGQAPLPHLDRRTCGTWLGCPTPAWTATAYCRFGPCLSTGLVFLKASLGALALVEASVGTMHSHGACPVAAVMRSCLGRWFAQDAVARLEMGQCLEWEQELFNDVARHDR